MAEEKRGEPTPVPRNSNGEDAHPLFHEVRVPVSLPARLGALQPIFEATEMRSLANAS